MTGKKVYIQYHALLREERNLPEEEWTTFATNARALYDELRHKYKFSLDCDRLRVAINNEFQNWDYAINNNDRIILVPPVAGG